MIAAGRNQNRLSSLVEECDLNKSAITALKLDVNDTEDIAKAGIHVSEGNQPQISGFVLCAGIGLPGTVMNSDNSHWAGLVETNVLSLMRQARSCAEHLITNFDEAKKDITKDIVIIGSTVGREISAKNPVYGATKAAVHSMTEALRREVCGMSVRISLVEPGFVRSEFQENSGYDMKWVQDMDKQIGPLLTPADIARCVSFILDQPSGVHVDDVRIRPTRQPV